MKYTSIIFLMLLLTPGLHVAAQDRSTPEATVRSFLAAFSRADLKEAAACVQVKQADDAAMEEIAKQFRKTPMSTTLGDAKVTVNGTSAVVSGQATMKTEKPVHSETFPCAIELAQSNDVWQIVPSIEKAMDRSKPDVINGLAISLAYPVVFLRARDRARESSCLSNVKQLCLGMLMFVQDHNGRYKVKPETLKKSLMPYTKNAGLFICPIGAMNDGDAATDSYSFNANLVGIGESAVKSKAGTVLFYEGKDGKLDFRHTGKAAIGFADGSVRMVNAEEAKKLRWKP